jgi:FkbM family methyltransferase
LEEYVMRIPSMSRIVGWINSRIKGSPDGFLKKVSGVIHVGANTGQERTVYEKLGLRVLWIEPIPEVFQQLQENIRALPRQRALQCLVTDRDDEEYQFHIANNGGQSSSILDLKLHKDIWPTIDYTGTMSLTSLTLASLLRREGIDPADYQALILDTQGSELLVLTGAVPVLRNFAYVKTEVADFESYAACCQLSDVEGFMTRHGYRMISRHKFASRPEGGSYFDVVYQRRARPGTAPDRRGT